MTGNEILRVIGSAFDPKREYQKEVPRAMLFAKLAVEYLFKLVGFFVVLCIAVGVIYSACPDNSLLLSIPTLLAAAFVFHITMTVVGRPVFLMISQIPSPGLRRLVGYPIVTIVFILSFFFIATSPILEVLDAYVSRFFPAALQCG